MTAPGEPPQRPLHSRLLSGAITGGALLGPLGCCTGFFHGLIAAGLAWHSKGPTEAELLLLALGYAAAGVAVGAGAGAAVAWATGGKGRSR